MSEVTIKFKSLGLPQIKADHKSILSMSKQLQVDLLHLEQNNAQRIKEINRDKINALSRLNEKYRNDQARLLKETERLEQQSAEKITRIHEREQLRRSQMAQRASVGGGGSSILGGAGHLMQAAGHYRTGHALRAMQSLNIGVGAAIGLGAVAVALAPTIVALDLLKNAAEATAGAFVSAIGEIGKARNLEQMIVESASTQRLAAQISANTTDQFSSKSILGIINRLSSTSEFSPTQIGEMAMAFKAKTGTFGDFSQLGGFATNLASVAGLSPQEAGGILGQLRTQFPGLSLNQTRMAAMQLWSLGRSGAVELKDAQSITQALGFAGKVSPDLVKGMASEMGFVQMAQRFTGGQTAESSVTGVRRLQEEMLKTPGKFGFLGNYLTHTSKGEAVFKDFDKTMALATLQSFRHPEATGFEARANKALYGIANAVSSQFTGNTEHDSKVLQDTFKAFQDGTKVIDEFTGAVKDVKDTVSYQFSELFNKLSSELEPMLLDSLKSLKPMIETFVNSVIAHKDDLINGIKAMASATAEILPGLISLGLILAQLAGPLLKSVVGLALTPIIAQEAVNRNALSSTQGRMNNLATELETGVWQAGVNKGKKLTPEEMKAELDKLNDTRTQRDNLISDINTEEAQKKALVNLPDALEKSTVALTAMMVQLQGSIDKNTKATDNNTPDNTPTAPTPDQDGKPQ